MKKKWNNEEDQKQKGKIEGRGVGGARGAISTEVVIPMGMDFDGQFFNVHHHYGYAKMIKTEHVTFNLLAYQSLGPTTESKEPGIYEKDSLENGRTKWPQNEKCQISR